MIFKGYSLHPGSFFNNYDPTPGFTLTLGPEIKLYGCSKIEGTPSLVSSAQISGATLGGPGIELVVKAGYTHNANSIDIPLEESGLYGIPLIKNEDLDNDGVYFNPSDNTIYLGDTIDFPTGKWIHYIGHEILNSTPNFVQSPDNPGLFIWDNALANVYKDHTHSCLMTFADSDTASIDGTSIWYYSDSYTAEELNQAFTLLQQDSSATVEVMGQLATPIEEDLSDDIMDQYSKIGVFFRDTTAFIETLVSEGISVLSTVYMEVNIDWSEFPNDPFKIFDSEYFQPKTEIGAYLRNLYFYILSAGGMGYFNEYFMSLPKPSCRETEMIKNILINAKIVDNYFYSNEKYTFDYRKMGDSDIEMFWAVLSILMFNAFSEEQASDPDFMQFIEEELGVKLYTWLEQTIYSALGTSVTSTKKKLSGLVSDFIEAGIIPIMAGSYLNDVEEGMPKSYCERLFWINRMFG